jgi:hypothetical protein
VRGRDGETLAFHMMAIGCQSRSFMKTLIKIWRLLHEYGMGT